MLCNPKKGFTESLQNHWFLPALLSNSTFFLPPLRNNSVKFALQEGHKKPLLKPSLYPSTASLQGNLIWQLQQQYFIMAYNFPITGAGTWGIMAKPPRVYASQRTQWVSLLSCYMPLLMTTIWPSSATVSVATTKFRILLSWLILTFIKLPKSNCSNDWN